MARDTIAVDIDEVLYPFVDSLIEYLDAHHHAKMKVDDFTVYSFKDIWRGGPVEADELFEQYKQYAGLEIMPIKGAAKALHELSEKYEVIVLTARDISNFPKTHAWLEHHFPSIFKDVHLLGNSNDSQKWTPKEEVCIKLGVSWMIDDNLDTILKVHEAGVGALLFGDYRWNQVEKVPSGIIRVKDWQEVLEYFDGRS